MLSQNGNSVQEVKLQVKFQVKKRPWAEGTFKFDNADGQSQTGKWKNSARQEFGRQAKELKHCQALWDFVYTLVEQWLCGANIILLCNVTVFSYI